MTTKVKGILCVGNSNGEPTGSKAEYIALVPELNYDLATPDPAIDIYYGKASKNIRYLTFYHPEATATDYPAGSPPAPFTDYKTYSKWLPWTTREGAANPNAIGFRQPNGWHRQKGAIGATYGTNVGVTLDLAQRLHGVFSTPIYVINSCIDGAGLQFHEDPLLLQVAWGWYDPRLHNCWDPAAPVSLATRLQDELDSALLASQVDDVEVEIVAVYVTLYDNTDSHIDAFSTNAPKFVEFLRQQIFNRGLCKCAPFQLPVIWEKPGTSVFAKAATVNAILDQMEQDDPSFGVYAVDTFSRPVGDAFHFSSTGHRQRGATFLAKFNEIRQRQTISLPLDDVPTLAEIRSRILREVERNQSDAGFDNQAIDEQVNNVLNDLFITAGDSAWWLRHVQRVTISGDPTTPTALPRTVTRLLEIHPAAQPLVKVPWTLQGHTDNGRLSILLLQPFSGQVDLHCIFEPRPLIADDDRPVIPRIYLDAVVAQAAWRLVHQGGNAQLEIKLKAKADRLEAKLSSHVNKTDRMRRERIVGNRSSAFAYQNMSRWSRNYPIQ